MGDESVGRYRIFWPESDGRALPPEVIVEEAYPGFVVVQAPERIVAELRRRHPVESLPAPQPPPSIPGVANMAEAVAASRPRGPYDLVVRFRAPVRQEWIDAVSATGCRPRAAIGSTTLVVQCPSKTSASRLRALPDVARVSDYVPQIQITPRFMQDLQVTPTAGAVADAARRRAGASEPAPAVADAAPSVPGALIADFFTADDCQSAERRLRREKIRDVTRAGETRLVVNLIAHPDPAKALQTLVTLPGLRSLQERPVRSLFNDRARQVIADRVVTQNPAGLGLTGQGEIVAVADSGLDTGDPVTLHPDLRGRVRDIRSFPITPDWSPMLNNPGGDDGAADTNSGHGTHVCGSVAGNGARAVALGLSAIQGTAPEAEIVFQAIEQTMDWNPQGTLFWLQRNRQPPRDGLFGIPLNLRDLFQPAFDLGARIHSNSWGGGVPGEYDDQCRDLDQYVWDHKEFLVVVAAGNSGTDVSPPRQGIDPGSVDSPGTAKNCLTVGASENDRAGQFPDTYGEWWPGDFPHAPFKSDKMADSVDDIVAFSSRGPCTTGRRKPDLVAPGTWILSTRSSQIAANNFSWGAFPPAKREYMYMGGTSMATPLVSGCAALVRQFLRQTQGMAAPSAALVKAILIHSAHYRSYRHAHASSSRWADNEQGWGRVDLQTVLNPAPPVRVLFIDEASGLQTGAQRDYAIQVPDASVPLRVTLVYTDFPGRDLINNLNLFAHDPTGQFFAGNDFAGSGTPDAANNVEGIVIEQPRSGSWTIRVVASDVPEGPQEFAIVLSGGGVQRV
jgi:subtilisin family serine protease